MREHDANDIEWIDSLEGASTNFLTNTVKLGLREEEWARLALGSLPVSCAPKLIHEAVHHWFFQSLVGESVALAKLLAYERVQKGDLAGAADIACRYRCLLALFRPILEGAALFGEFDALPLSNKSAPIPPHKILPLLFARAPGMAEILGRSKSGFAAVVLNELRAYDYFVEEKCRLFEGRGDNAVNYLFGYHDIKQWWIRFIIDDNLNCYRDGSLFLKVVHMFFFNDFNIASILFDPEASLEASVHRLATYLDRRIKHFPELASRTELASALNDLAPEQGVTIKELVALGVFERDAVDGIMRTADAMFFVMGNGALDPSELPALKIQQNRQALSVASESVHWHFSGGKDFSIKTLSGIELFHGQFQEAINQCVEDGHFCSYLFPDRCALVITVSLRESIVFQKAFGPESASDSVFATASKLEVNRAELDKLFIDTEARLETYMRAHGVVQSLLAWCTAQKRQMFGYVGCTPGHESQARAWLDRVAESGLAGQFSDPTWTRALAMLGAAHARHDTDMDRIVAALGAEGMDGPAALIGLAEVSSETALATDALGWRLLAVVDDRWWPLL